MSGCIRMLWRFASYSFTCISHPPWHMFPWHTPFRGWWLLLLYLGKHLVHKSWDKKRTYVQSAVLKWDIFKCDALLSSDLPCLLSPWMHSRWWDTHMGLSEVQFKTSISSLLSLMWGTCFRQLFWEEQSDREAVVWECYFGTWSALMLFGFSSLTFPL